MRLRRKRLLTSLNRNEIAPTVTNFPLMGVGSFTDPPTSAGVSDSNACWQLSHCQLRSCDAGTSSPVWSDSCLRVFICRGSCRCRARSSSRSTSPMGASTRTLASARWWPTSGRGGAPRSTSRCRSSRTRTRPSSCTTWRGVSQLLTRGWGCGASEEGASSEWVKPLAVTL